MNYLRYDFFAGAEGSIDIAEIIMFDTVVSANAYYGIVEEEPAPEEPATMTLDLTMYAEAVDFAAAGYTGKVLQLFNYGNAVCLGDADMGGIAQVIITYGCDGGAMLGDVGSELVLTKNGAVADANNAPIDTAEIIGKVTLTNPEQGWAAGSREAVIEIDSDYVGPVYLCHNMKDGNGVAVSSIVLVFKGE